ncbi:MAG TPA: Fur family transcriptional regulator [Gaiellaceae bacterium]|nr:Fur family transcriptional regulator [Gaiellaceae bacterium]
MAGKTLAQSWAETTLNGLLAKGLRQGSARRAIVELLGEQDCCLTAQEILDRLRAADRRVGIASVYRILDLLVGEGYVQKIELGSGICRYEPIQPGGEHHHHLVCDSCGKVEPFEDPRLERALGTVEQHSGFDVSLHDVVLHGACGACR